MNRFPTVIATNTPVPCTKAKTSQKEKMFVVGKAANAIAVIIKLLNNNLQ